jgi:hypothetical protein
LIPTKENLMKRILSLIDILLEELKVYHHFQLS